MQERTRAKRTHKSIYYDRYTGQVNRAGLMPSRACVRPRRYLFLFHSPYTPTIYNKRVVEALTKHGIKIPKQKNLPF